MQRKLDTIILKGWSIDWVKVQFYSVTEKQASAIDNSILHFVFPDLLSVKDRIQSTEK